MARLQLLTLVCNVTEDFLGPDEAFLLVNGTQVFGPQSINNSQSRDLSAIPPIDFSSTAAISLFDEDNPPFDPNDFLGTVTASEAQAGRGRQQGTFTLDGASYEIVYEVLAEEIGGNFTFDPAITPAQRTRLLERQRFAFGRIMSCSSLSDSQKSALRDAYERPIRHGIETRPTVNASAFVNGSDVFVNFNVLFPQGDREIAQTLIHEMVHCAGFTHPDRRDAPNPNPDVPGDNGPYFGSPPLQAELCIAGIQSDLTCVPDSDGRCVLRTK